MMDYRTHFAVLQTFRLALGQEVLADAQIAELRDQHVATLDEAPEMALVGSVIDHLFAHASSDGAELALLERAAKLWREGLKLYEGLAKFRSSLELVLNNPGDERAVEVLNSASESFAKLARRVKQQSQQVEALRKEVSKHPHLRAHSRQDDKPISEWSWDNLLLARRTEAFVRELYKLADTPEKKSFALGALCSYGANAGGSMYLGQVVGGPRRSHRFRDRLARNTVGSWTAQHFGRIVGQYKGSFGLGHDSSQSSVPFPPLRIIARQLKRAMPNGLPASIQQIILSALSRTYDANEVPPLPDPKRGFQRLLRHLELLDAFPMPTEPVAPPDSIVARLFGDPTKPFVPSIPETTAMAEAGVPPGEGGHVLPQNFGSGGGGSAPPEEPDWTESKCAKFWKAIFIFLFFVGPGWKICAAIWSEGNNQRCPIWDEITQSWEEAFSDGVFVEAEGEFSNPLTVDDTGILAQNEQVLQLVGDLYNVQSMMWEGFQKASEFLSLYGLIYPDAFIDRWRYSQYVSIPSIAQGQWPRLPDNGRRFDEYPLTGIEHPAATFIPFPAGSSPLVIFTGPSGAANRSSLAICKSMWAALASNSTAGTNLDLDADRGWMHPCWRAGGPITAQPLSVVPLQYSEI